MATEQQPLLNLRPLKTAAEIAAEAAAKPQVPPGAPLRTAVQTAMAAPSGGPIGTVPTSRVGGPIGQVPTLRTEQLINPNLTGYTPGPVAAPRTPFVNPGGQLTMGEFAAGGARPNMYGLYDPKGAANVQAAGQAMGRAYQAGYVPGQYTPSSSAVAAPAPAAPAPNMSAVRPSVVAPTGAAPMASAGGVGSRLMGAAGMVGKAVPFIGDAIQAAAYGMDPNSNASTMGRIGRGVAAGLGSFGGRVLGGAGGTLVAPGVGTAVGSVTGSIGGAAGGAALYDSVFGEPEVAPMDEAQEFQKRMDMRTGDSPELRERRTTGDLSGLSHQTARAIDAQRDTRANYPSFFEPAATRLSPVVMKKDPAPKGEFKGPSSDEMARFRKETGTPYDPKSVTDKLNLERMRGGEETFTSKQSREFRKSNPTYRPGQYVKRG